MACLEFQGRELSPSLQATLCLVLFPKDSSRVGNRGITGVIQGHLRDFTAFMMPEWLFLLDICSQLGCGARGFGEIIPGALMSLLSDLGLFGRGDVSSRFQRGNSEETLFIYLPGTLLSLRITLCTLRASNSSGERPGRETPLCW